MSRPTPGDLVRPGHPDLAAAIDFVVEADRLKGVLRRNRVADGSRRENTGEHSWHVATMAIVLAPWAGPDVDAGRAARMLLVHDIVEIDADDVFVYDAEDPDVAAAKAEREARAAARIFGLLPPSGPDLRALWDEFEARETPDARYAAAIDRLQPLLLNFVSGGAPWQEHGITADQVRRVNTRVGEASPALGTLVAALVEAAIADGILGPAPG